ncbi:uncharacterized protein, partial [Palaemon carinicauda]|uniref:uncharacterized protein n=1 Tax=Palaemon carinicauda TaxID=392227 RepID=UPI0035B62403
GYPSWARNYSWPFLIADVKVPLLGADFLAHHGLLVDVRRKQLVEQETYQSHHLSKFPEVFKPELHQLKGFPAKHGIFHHISTTGPPTHCRLRTLPPQKLQDAKLAFKTETMGICKKGFSLWASPLHKEALRQL